jgi:hypothetical protein
MTTTVRMKSWDSAEFLTTEGARQAYMAEALESGDQRQITEAAQTILRAKNMHERGGRASSPVRIATMSIGRVISELKTAGVSFHIPMKSHLKTTKAEKSVAAAALTQKGSKETTSAKVATSASKILRSKTASKAAKSAAASALTQKVKKKK